MHDLTTLTYGKVKDTEYNLVILPWGATEPHNYHLPYLTDSILSHDIAVESAELALKRHGVRCMVLPPVNLGSQNPGQRELKFCIHTRYETQKAILTDIISSLKVQNFNRMIIINGHGGNSFKNMIRDLSVDFPDFVIATSEWYTVIDPSEYFCEPGDHAGELETSVMMYYHPELVDMKEAGSGSYKAHRLKSLRDKTIWIPRNWQEISTDTGVGNPQFSSKEKGERFAKAITEKYADCFAEISRQEN